MSARKAKTVKNEQAAEPVTVAYKAFDAGLKCRDFQYYEEAA